MHTGGRNTNQLLCVCWLGRKIQVSTEDKLLKKNLLKKIGKPQMDKEVIVHRYRNDRVAKYMASLSENKKYIGWQPKSLFGTPHIIRNSGWYDKELNSKDSLEISALDDGAYIVIEEV
tara:strand:+ start:1487 stop:1840 length:354 start_codon:yes stop_codon:yes gene_type:complete